MKTRPFRLRRCPGALLTLRCGAGLACLLLAIPNGVSAPASPSDVKTPTLRMTDDGFTRETLQEFDNPPEPRSFAPAPTASLDESTADRPSHMVLHHHHHRRHHQEQAEDPHQVVVAKPSARRNPVESFVYWWNGWVIRNFHTRNGTVLLDKIGAKT